PHPTPARRATLPADHLDYFHLAPYHLPSTVYLTSKGEQETNLLFDLARN
ncbi:hypothetical protein IMZ48_01015, partial [Candidatus Bathyarchaeota archaeon]|nr:hypothetical protein [Candidatus Bathyarchaeota archaeon]